jgi:hypothetical protein
MVGREPKNVADPPDRWTATGDNRPEQSRPDPLGSLLTTVSAVLGLVVTVTALNVDRSWRIAAILLGVGGILVSLFALRLSSRRRIATGTGVALLVVACTVLVFSPPTSVPAAPKPRSSLALSQFDVTGGTSGPAMLDVTVHNLGRRRAVLTGVRMTMRDFLYLPDCYTAGTVEPSRPYPVTLPDNPPSGAVMTIPLHEEVGADQVDRFTVGLHGPVRTAKGPRGSYPVGGTFLYRFGAALTADVQENLPLGTAIVATPLDPHPSGQVWNPDDPQRVAEWKQHIAGSSPIDLNTPDMQASMRCLDSNSRALKTLLARPGRRSDTLDHVLTSTP